MQRGLLVFRIMFCLVYCERALCTVIITVELAWDICLFTFPFSSSFFSISTLFASRVALSFSFTYDCLASFTSRGELWLGFRLHV